MGLTVYTGCMYSGKTTKLLKSIMREVDFANEFWKETIIVYNHFLDSGAKDKVIRNHSGMSFPAKSISGLGSEIINLKKLKHLRIFINEIQFFEPDIIGHIDELMKHNFGYNEIYVCGLDLNSFGKPFPITAELLCRADKVVKLAANNCAYIDETIPEGHIIATNPSKYRNCYNTATRTQRLIQSDQVILPQGDNQKFYEPRCIEHFHPA